VTSAGKSASRFRKSGVPCNACNVIADEVDLRALRAAVYRDSAEFGLLIECQMKLDAHFGAVNVAEVPLAPSRRCSGAWMISGYAAMVSRCNRCAGQKPAIQLETVVAWNWTYLVLVHQIAGALLGGHLFLSHPVGASQVAYPHKARQCVP
jgi:hypothetical protein